MSAAIDVHRMFVCVLRCRVASPVEPYHNESSRTSNSQETTECTQRRASLVSNLYGK